MLLRNPQSSAYPCRLRVQVSSKAIAQAGFWMYVYEAEVESPESAELFRKAAMAGAMTPTERIPLDDLVVLDEI